MRCVVARLACGWMAAALAASLSAFAQQPPDTFRWINFHSAKDQDIVVWVTRSLAVDDWTAIREIGVEYDAALVITTDRATPQSAPGSDTFTIWSASLTNHSATPLLKGVHLRIFDWERFSRSTPEELPMLYDNCLNCAATTYFTAFHYDLARHDWEARWIRDGQGIPVWNTKPVSGIAWSQAYAVLPEGDGHVELYTWNHFDYGRQKPPEDFVYRYDLDPFSELGRTVLLSGKDAAVMEQRLCTEQDAVPGLARGQDSPACDQLAKPRWQRHPVTTPPANNRGQSAPRGWPR